MEPADPFKSFLSKSLPPLWHPVLGIPAVPALGKYFKSSYVLPQHVAILSFELAQEEEQPEYVTFREGPRRVRLPRYLVDELQVHWQVPRNRTPKAKPDVPYFEDFQFEYRGLLKLYVLISAEVGGYEKAYYNYVPHPFVFKDEDIEFSKRNVRFLSCKAMQVEGELA
jgi:hypothetical protein